MATIDEKNKIAIPITITGKKTEMLTSFRAMGADGQVLGQMTKSLLIEGIPGTFALHHNYPNPFNPITIIQYDIPVESDVHLVIYDILGKQVKTLVNGYQTAGYKSMKWNGTNDQGRMVSAGMYFYHLQSGKFSKVRKMILLKFNNMRISLSQ